MTSTFSHFAPLARIGSHTASTVFRLARHERTKRILPMLIVFALVAALNTVGVHAQNGSVGDAVQRSWQEIYNSWRGPICILALLIAAVLLFTGGRNSLHWVFKIVVGVILFALGPALYATLSHWGTG